MNEYVFECVDHSIRVLAFTESEAEEKLKKILGKGEELYSLDDFKLIECS